MKHLVISIYLILSTNIANSVEWGKWEHIKEIYTPVDGGSPYIQFETSSAPLPGCYADSGAYLIGSDLSRSYSALLAVLMANKKIRPLYEIHNPNDQGWGRCKITSFYIQ